MKNLTPRMLCLLAAKPCCWPSPFHFSRAQGHQSQPWQCSGEVWQQFQTLRDGLVLNPSGQDLGAVCGNLREAFPLLPVPGKSLVHQFCSVTILPRAGAALVKPALFGLFFPYFYKTHLHRCGWKDFFFLYFPVSQTELGSQSSS